MFWWVIHSSFWFYQFVRHLGEMKHVAALLYIFLAKIRPKSEVKSWSRHSWVSQWNYARHYFIAPYVMSCTMDANAHSFAVFLSIEMPPVSISMLHAATEKAHKLIGRKSKQINQSMSGGSAVMSNFPWTSLSWETKLLHVYACM